MCLNLCRARWRIYQAIFHTAGYPWRCNKHVSAWISWILFNDKIIFSFFFAPLPTSMDCPNRHKFALSLEVVSIGRKGNRSRKSRLDLPFHLLPFAFRTLLGPGSTPSLPKPFLTIRRNYRFMEVRAGKDPGNRLAQPPHFTGQETEAQWGEVSCPRSHF